MGHTVVVDTDNMDHISAAVVEHNTVVVHKVAGCMVVVQLAHDLQLALLDSQAVPAVESALVVL